MLYEIHTTGEPFGDAAPISQYSSCADKFPTNVAKNNTNRISK